MLDHHLIAVLDSSTPLAPRRASVGAAATEESLVDKLGGRMTVFMALGGLVGGALGWKLGGALGGLVGGGAGLFAGHIAAGDDKKKLPAADGKLPTDDGTKKKLPVGDKPPTGKTPPGLGVSTTPPDLGMPGLPTVDLTKPVWTGPVSVIAPGSPAEVLARDPRPWANPAGVWTTNWAAERKVARFPASQKVVSSSPAPLYRAIVGFTGTPEAPIPVYSEAIYTLTPEVVQKVLEGLYSIDGITYWVGDPATPPGTVSSLFPVDTGGSEGGWSSSGAVPGLYLPTQGDLYLIQQAFLPAEGDDPDRLEAVAEIQRLLDGAGGPDLASPSEGSPGSTKGTGLRPLGPKSATHMPPVLLNAVAGI